MKLHTSHILSSLFLGMALTSAVPTMAQTDADSVFIYYKDGTTVDKYACKEIVRLPHILSNLRIVVNII